MNFTESMQHLQDVLLTTQGQNATIYRPSTDSTVYEGKLVFVCYNRNARGLQDSVKAGVRRDTNSIECLLPANSYTPARGDVVNVGQSSYIVAPYEDSTFHRMDGFNSMIKVRLSQRS